MDLPSFPQIKAEDEEEEDLSLEPEIWMGEPKKERERNPLWCLESPYRTEMSSLKTRCLFDLFFVSFVFLSLYIYENKYLRAGFSSVSLRKYYSGR